MPSLLTSEPPLILHYVQIQHNYVPKISLLEIYELDLAVDEV